MGPDGKVVKVPQSQQVVVDKEGLPVIGADAKAVLVPLNSALIIPYADGKAHSPPHRTDGFSLLACV